MGTPEMEWYRELRDNPLKGRSFNRELAARIQWRANLSASGVRSPRRRLQLAGAGVLLLGAAVCAVAALERGEPAEREVLRAAPPAMPAESQPSVAASLPPAAMTDPAQLAAERSLSDDEWESLLKLKDPLADKRILLRQSWGNDLMLIYSKRGGTNYATNLDLYKWEDGQWTWSAGGFFQFTTSEPDGAAEGNELGSGGTLWDEGAVFSGVIQGTGGSIAEVRLRDPNGGVRQAEMIRGEDGNRYWLAGYPGADVHGTYTAEFLDASGKVLRDSQYNL